MKTIEEIVNGDPNLQAELSKIPERQLCTLRCLTNIYVLSCLTGQEKQMLKQRERIEGYILKLESAYKVEARYLRTALNNIKGYFSASNTRREYNNVDTTDENLER